MTPSDDDDVLMASLRDAVAEDALVTDRHREAARAAFSWRTIDEELMDLVHDSAEGELVVRSVATARVFGFEGPDLSLEVELDAGVLTGQVAPGQSCRVTVVSRDADPVVLETDETGFFTAGFETAGTVRFVVDTGDGSLSTAWVVF